MYLHGQVVSRLAVICSVAAELYALSFLDIWWIQADWAMTHEHWKGLFQLCNARIFSVCLTIQEETQPEEKQSVSDLCQGCPKSPSILIQPRGNST